MKNGWLDISVPIKDGMVHWPGDPEIEIRRIKDLEAGDTATLSHISMGSHTGTHMDAPGHFIVKGKSIDQMPLDATVGRCRVIEIKAPDLIRSQELKPKGIRSGERILFKTQNSSRVWSTDSFVKDFVSISLEAAAYLAKSKVRCVGVDYLSVGAFQGNGPEVHRSLLSAGIWIIEGLNLSKIKAGRYDLVCLPLRILNGDGSPARAILRKM